MPSKKDVAGIRAIGIDTGKNTLHMIGLDEKGAIVLREKVSRGRIAARLVNVPASLIGIEAGMATLYMSRELVAFGGFAIPAIHSQTIFPPFFWQFGGLI